MAESDRSTTKQRGNGNGGPALDRRDLLYQATLAFNSVLGERRRMARKFGQLSAYSGNRDYNTVLGYPTELSIADLRSRYDRQDIAGRIVDLPAQDTWRVAPLISEEGETETPFAQAWEAVERRLRVFSRLSRADRISGIGRYGVLYIGYRDGVEFPELPVDHGKLSRPEDVLFLRPFSEGNATIDALEENSQSERFGLPAMYKLEVDNGQTLRVHWSRCLHLADNRLDSEVYGIPRLQRVFNRLDDLIKIVGGSAEASWLNMRPGTLLTTQEGYELGADSETQQRIQDEIEEYLHGMARMMTLEGADLKSLAGQIMNPKEPFEVLISLLAAASGIPQRILLGSAAGELASAVQDEKQWYGHIAWRQQNYAEPEILRPLLDTWVAYGVLPKPGSGGYQVGELAADGESWTWPPLFQLSEKDLADVRSANATAARALADPVTGELPLTQEEVRELLGYARAPVVTRVTTDEAPAEEGTSMEDVVAQMGQGNQLRPMPLSAGELATNHTPEIVTIVCPLCSHNEADRYGDHGGLCVCKSCGCTFDPSVSIG